MALRERSVDGNPREAGEAGVDGVERRLRRLEVVELRASAGKQLQSRQPVEPDGLAGPAQGSFRCLGGAASVACAQRQGAEADQGERVRLGSLEEGAGFLDPDLFVESAAPYEAALARLALADALRQLGRQEAAAAEAKAASDAFAALGASADAERAEQLPLSVGGAGDGGVGELTPREREVLALVAQGMSDAEIAARLVVSPHTVHRHVANIRTKLRLPSRAAAVAYAAREGLL